MNHEPDLRAALDRCHARRTDTEDQLRSLRGKALSAPLAELDGLLVYEVQLEARLTEVLTRNLATAGPDKGASERQDRGPHLWKVARLCITLRNRRLLGGVALVTLFGAGVAT